MRWRAAGAVAVLALLLVGAVRVGLWWSGADRTDPTSASTLPAAAVTAGDASEPAADQSSDTAQPVRVRDWTAVVATLDAARAAALTARDPGLLADVYTADAPARAADAHRIEVMRHSGYHVTAAAHFVRSATLQARGDHGSVTLRVVESMPSYPILDDGGSVVGSTAASTGSVLLELRSTEQGFRIRDITQD